MRQDETVSARVRAAVARLGTATLDDIRAAVPEASAQLLYALTKAGHLKRSGAVRAYVYAPGKTPRVYGGTPEQRRETRERRLARMRERYAAVRGGLVRPRRRPGSNPAAPATEKPPPPPNPPSKRRKPTSSQQVVIRPALAPLFAAPQPKPRLMTSQEWEAQGGVVERLPPGAVSRSELRHTYTA